MPRMTWFDAAEEVKHDVPRTPEDVTIRVYTASAPAEDVRAAVLPPPSGGVGATLTIEAAPEAGGGFFAPPPIGTAVDVLFPAEPVVSFAGKLVRCVVSHHRPQSAEYPCNVRWTDPSTGHALVRAVKLDWLVVLDGSGFEKAATPTRAKAPVKKRRG